MLAYTVGCHTYHESTGINSYFAHKVFGVCGCSGRPPGYLGKAKESLDFWHTLAAFVKNKQQIFWWVTDAFFTELSWRTTFLTRDDKTLTRSRCLQCTELQHLAELKREGQRRQCRQRPTAKSTAVHSPARIAVSILCLRVFRFKLCNYFYINSVSWTSNLFYI